jgi:hypothetical protein
MSRTTPERILSSCLDHCRSGLEECSLALNQALAEYNAIGMPTGVYPTQQEYNNFSRVVHAFRETGRNPVAYSRRIPPELLTPLMEWNEKVIRLYEEVNARIGKGIIKEEDYSAVMSGTWKGIPAKECQAIVKEAFTSVWPTYESWESQVEQVKQIKASLVESSGSCADSTEMYSRIARLYTG